MPEILHSWWLLIFKKEESVKESLIFSLSLLGQIGLSTAIPLVALGLGGRYLDHRFGTTPYLFLLGLLVATVIIFFTLKKIVKEATASFNKMNEKNPNTKKQ